MKLPFANDGRVRLDLSSDGAHVIASVHEGDRERCVSSGRELPDVVWLRGRSPERHWSAGASRRAAIVRQGRLVRVVTSDAQRDVWSEPQEDARVSRFAFRRGDDRFAYFAKRRGAWWIDREGEEPVGPFDEIASLAWHGAHLVGVVRLGEAWRVWIDGRALPCRTSRPNVHVAHGSVALVDGRDGVSEVLHDDRVIGPFTTRPRVELGRDGRLVMSVELDRWRTEVRLGDGAIVGAFTRVRSLERCTGPRGDRLAFAYDDGDRSGFFVDGVRHDGLGYSDGPWWSPDGAHLLWAAERARGETSEAFAVLDGHERVLPTSIDWEMGSSVRVTTGSLACLFTLDRASDRYTFHVGDRSFGPFGYPTASARREDHEVVAVSRDGYHFAFQHGDDAHAYVRLDDDVVGPLPRNTTFTLTDRELVLASLDDDASEVTIVRRSLDPVP